MTMPKEFLVEPLTDGRYQVLRVDGRIKGVYKDEATARLALVRTVNRHLRERLARETARAARWRWLRRAFRRPRPHIIGDLLYEIEYFDNLARVGTSGYLLPDRLRGV